MQPPTIITGKQPEISIWLDDSKENEHYPKKFHCPVCGKVVFEYYGYPRMIVVGGHELKDAKIIQCHGTIKTIKNGYECTTRCKARYSIE